MKLIGKGLFSKVYLKTETTVLIKSVCRVKECISFNHSKHFPELIRTDWQEYECKYYQRVKSLKDSLNSEDYKVYQELRKIFNESFGGCSNPYDNYSYYYKLFSKLSNKSFRKSILETLDNLADYGTDIIFEISPRNVAVDNGKLILLDIFFFREQLLQTRNKK